MPRFASTSRALGPSGAGPAIDECSSVRAWGAIAALALAVFTVTATELMPIGVLPQIATDFGVSDGAAGLTVTMYGILAGLSAPVMTFWTGRANRRTLVLSILAVFVVGNLATAVAPSYPLLLVVRLGIGLGHGLMWSIIAGVAVRLVPARAAAHATAVVFSGISLALVAGVPIGTVLGVHLGWRATFVALAVVTALAWLGVRLLVPKPLLQGAIGANKWRELARVRSGLRPVLAVTALVVIGNYAAYTYIAPFLIGSRDIHPSAVGTVLLVYGVFGVVGNFAAGAALRRAEGAHRMLVVALPMVVAAALAVLVLAPSAAAVMLPMVAGWGIAYSALPVILQTLIFRVADDSPEAATALYVLVFNVSIAGGAAAGALATNTLGAPAALLLGAAVCLAAAGAGLALLRARRTEDEGGPHHSPR